MDTCITVWHWPNDARWFDEGIRRSLDAARAAGFSHINWNPDAGSSYWLGDAEIEFTARIVREAGLKAHTVHGSNGRNPVSEVRWRRGSDVGRETRKDFMSPVEWQRKSGVELIMNRIDLAAALSAPNIVMHIDITDDVFASPDATERFFEPLERSLDELQPYCRAKAVAIAVETLFCASAASFLQLYERLFARYDPGFIGLCYDSGHWELIEPGALTVLERFGERLLATHIHDNFGAMDDHLLPFDGRLDWQAICGLIARTAYVTPLNFETPMDRYGLPEPVYMQRAQKVAVRLEAMIAEARRGNAA